MQRILGDFLGGRAAVGLLVLRVVVGLGLMMHGWNKIQNPFGWMNKPGAPSDIPGFMQALAALGEFGGGLGLIVGLLTPLAALGVIFTMLGAYFISHQGDPWIKPGAKGTWELASLYFIMALTILLTGPGRYSLDAIIFGKKRR